MFDNIQTVKLWKNINGKSTEVGIATYSSYDVQKERLKSDSEYNKLPFIVSDLIDFTIDRNISIEYITCIHTFNIYKEYRGKGIGSEVFDGFIKLFNELSHLICIKSAPLKANYPTEPDTIIHINELIKQGYFLEMHGFRDINSLCQFENSIAYIYVNDMAKPIIKEIISDEIKRDE